MSSRLDRLFLLLDNGGSTATRKAAALQLGEVVRLHPHELPSLLPRLLKFITSKSWETRIAAGQAVEAIISNIPAWDPLPIKCEEDSYDSSTLESLGNLSLTSFSINNVLQKGSFLLGYDDSHFEAGDEGGDIDPNVKAAQLRVLVNQTLGLGQIVDTEGIISNDDLTSTSEASTPVCGESVVEIVQSEMTQAGFVRKLRRGKRKAKFLAQISADHSDKYTDCGSEKKRSKLMSEVSKENSDENGLNIVEDNKSLDWPLMDFTENLCQNLFSSSWETRHGAATSLREVIRIQGRGAGKTANQTAEQMQLSHEKWLEDKAVRFVCVLALDRFGDFLTDQVVAPVRETCAQVLGGIVRLLPEKSVMEILALLLEMLTWHEWDTRHGGLLGLKYTLAVRSDLRKRLLTEAYSSILKGLEDEMDDVVAVAATCLVPVADDLVTCLPAATIHHIMKILWDSLLDIDDLTASTNSVLQLLAKLLSCKHIVRNIPKNLDQLVSRIWPFLYHSGTSVRVSALKTIEALTASQFVSETDDKMLVEEFTEDRGKCDDQNENNIKDTCDKIKISADTEENWMERVLEPLLIHTYQRALLDNDEEALNLVIKIWDHVIKSVSIGALLMVSCRYLRDWLNLLMTTARAPLDPNLVVVAYHPKSDGHRKLRRVGELGECPNKIIPQLYLGSNYSCADDILALQYVSRARRVAAQLLGNLSYYMTHPMPGAEYLPDETPILCFVKLLLSHLNSHSGVHRLGGALVAREWALQHPQTRCHPILEKALLSCVSETIYYDEISWSFMKLQQETKDFIAVLRHYKIQVDQSYTDSPILTMDEIKCLCESVVLDIAKLRRNVNTTLEGRRKNILKSVTQTSGDQLKLNTTIQAVVAGALVRFQTLPDKLNPIIKPLMESIKKEADEEQRNMAAADLTFMLELCLDRQPCPNPKVVKNLVSFLCVDEEVTPNVLNKTSLTSLEEGILSLSLQERVSHRHLLRSNSRSLSRGPGRPLKVFGTATPDSESYSDFIKDSEAKKENEIQRRGCARALISMAEYFGPELEKRLPHMVAMIFDLCEHPPSLDSFVDPSKLDELQAAINWHYFLETIIPSLHPTILQRFESYLNVFDKWLSNPYSSIRHMAGRVLASLALVSQSYVMTHLVENVIPALSDLDSDARRKGAIECVYIIIEKLAFRVVPYIVFLIVPLMGRMSDQVESVRLLATHCFATLVRLFPLDWGLSAWPELSPALRDQREKERVFLDRLIDPSKIEDYPIPVPINADLRPYQQTGINWLAFLNQYNLHGILCDDMGLGKTLQSICILAGDHFTKETRIREGMYVPSKLTCRWGIQSLVVCPPTLTSHWYYEIGRFVSRKFLNPLNYTGPPVERKRLRACFYDHNLIIASYKIVRNEVDFFKSIKWNYIILDEGHIIKNWKTKSSKAIKELVGNHRLILSGTPIQNSVLELWSLFDFLMPGFLGTERQFTSKYYRPILQSRDPKGSAKDQEEGALAMEALHRQALPFLLRRLKEDVLKDLPPKITQDYYCELSPLQEKLYEDFTKSKAGQSIDGSFSGGEDKVARGHIFQALQYLRRVCNHPKLALLPNHPQYDNVLSELKENKTSLSDISHSAKLPALKQLLQDCGIGSNDDEAGIASASVVSQHRALIFCQLKGMLDIIENDLLKAHMRSVTYLRLDGSVPAGIRHSLVQRFNADPSIDVLLLTTQVGGLGLNLTGADTVIFVEHDWNPMNDLQAMDRAHRIGQDRVVNVYRLISKGTLEEKIMSLQKFKLLTARSVISEENSSLLSMGTDQLLDLFTLNSRSGSSFAREAGTAQGKGQSATAGIKEVIQNLPELWDESLYENEYNIDTFMSSLK